MRDLHDEVDPADLVHELHSVSEQSVDMLALALDNQQRAARAERTYTLLPV